MNILYLEDSPLDVDLLSRYMRCVDARFIVANTIEDAYQCLLEQPVDIFLVDIVIGNQMSYSLIEKVVAEKRCRYVVAITARALPSERRQYLKLGCHAVIAKPFTIDDLENTLKPLV